MKREPLQVAWDIALGDLPRRHPELADLTSHRRAFRNAAALAGSFAVLALLQGDGLSVAELQRQVDELA